jgi:hypothetical protein
MALYINGHATMLNLNGVTYYLNLVTSLPVINDVILLSSDGYIPQDLNGLSLIIGPTSGDDIESSILSSDGYILKEIRSLYLSNKEDE